MSFGGRHVPEEFGGRGLGPFAALMLRVVLAGAGAGTLVWIASAAMLFNTAPEWLSLVFEPLSLLLLPGMIVAVAATGPHDLDPSLVLEASVALYFVCFLAVLERRARRRRGRRRRG